MIFLAARRDALVIKALERGLVYDEDNPQIALLLAETLLRQHKPDRALDLVDRSIERQPQGVEAYELLARVLKALGRDPEITPRLEAAAERDSKNVPLKYVLADRYRETGQVEKAEALYKSLLTSQPTPQTFRALAASLLKRKKAGDLLKVFCEAVDPPNTQEAIIPQLLAVAQDDEMAEAMLDAGIEQLSATPPAVSPSRLQGPRGTIAGSDRVSPNKPRRLEKLLKLHQLELGQSPSPLVLREIADTQRRLGRFAEAAATVAGAGHQVSRREGRRHPGVPGRFPAVPGRVDAAKATLAEARKLDAHDQESLLRLAYGLMNVGQTRRRRRHPPRRRQARAQ